MIFWDVLSFSVWEIGTFGGLFSFGLFAGPHGYAGRAATFTWISFATGGVWEATSLLY